MKTLILAAFAACLGAPALAQQACMASEQIYAVLSNQFHERRVTTSYVQGSEGHYVLEVWGSEEEETMSLLMTLPDGRSCLMIAGEAFEIHDAEPKL